MVLKIWSRTLDDFRPSHQQGGLTVHRTKQGEKSVNYSDVARLSDLEKVVGSWVAMSTRVARCAVAGL